VKTQDEIEQARYQQEREVAYAKRREYDLQLWLPEDQKKYRDLRDRDGMTHEQASAAVSEARKANVDARAAEYDRTHKSKFKYNPVTGKGGYV
jgi:hypothetical protein